MMEELYTDRSKTMYYNENFTVSSDGNEVSDIQYLATSYTIFEIGKSSFSIVTFYNAFYGTIGSLFWIVKPTWVPLPTMVWVVSDLNYVLPWWILDFSLKNMHQMHEISYQSCFSFIIVYRRSRPCGRTMWSRCCTQASLGGSTHTVLTSIISTKICLMLKKLQLYCIYTLLCYPSNLQHVSLYKDLSSVSFRSFYQQILFPCVYPCRYNRKHPLLSGK